MPHAASGATVSAPSPVYACGGRAPVRRGAVPSAPGIRLAGSGGLGVELVLVSHSAASTSTFTRPSATDTFTTICPV
jgi:hypothetical protein